MHERLLSIRSSFEQELGGWIWNYAQPEEEIPRSSTIGCLELIVTDNVCQEHFEFIDRKKPSRAGMLTVSKWQIGLIRCGGQMPRFVSRSITHSAESRYRE